MNRIIDIQVTGIGEVEALLDRIAAKAKNMRPVMSEIGNYFQNTIEESFETGRAPDGETWSPLADSTLLQKNKDGSMQSMGKLLYDEGTLFESIGYEASSTDVVAGVNAYSKDGYPYPLVHLFGSKDGKIPARKFMPIDGDGELDEGAKEEAIELLIDYISRP